MHYHSDSPKELNIASAAEIVQQIRNRVCRNTSRVFAVLMVLQWVGAVLTAFIISPKTWTGTTSEIHVHVWAAIFLGGIITALPVGLALAYPEKLLTRHIVAAGQMLMSALLIHITGGRVETHFHVFGSLAILAFYRDWRVLLTASVIVYIDHLVRGYYWPQSVYGVLTASPWRAVEHAWWVGFEVAFLIVAIRQSNREMEQIGERQSQLQSVNIKIEAEVLERTAELKASNKQMETFCYSMSHDLRAPLRGIRAFSQILAEDHGENLNEQARDCVKRIGDAATRMDILVLDLLQYSRVSTLKFSPEPVSLSRITNEVIRLLSMEIQDQKATVTTDSDLGIVLGHEATLIQVMLNLVGNALKHGKLGVTPVLHIRSESRANHIRIFVQDNGIGIAPEYQQKIFEIFERIPTPGRNTGTGVGLAIVAKSMERLSGTFGVESTPGTGSTFWFELPAVTSVIASEDLEAKPALTIHG
ncbi:MAG: Histidine kinase [Verrucomicrobiales bacterium]|nr:Histidine kinase [Verrucomicrobiales bacterium]